MATLPPKLPDVPIRRASADQWGVTWELPGGAPWKPLGRCLSALWELQGVSGTGQPLTFPTQKYLLTWPGAACCSEGPGCTLGPCCGQGVA